MKHKHPILLLLLAVLLLLSACGGEGQGSPAASGITVPATTTAAPTTAAADTTAPPATTAAAEEVILLKDADGLCAVRVEGGMAFARLNPEVWTKRYRFTDFAVDFSDSERYLAVGGLSAPVVGGCAAVISNTSSWVFGDDLFPPLMLTLLLEDGTVAWTLLDPYSEAFSVVGVLPYLDGVTALEPGDSAEDADVRVICALDAKGRRCDLSPLLGHSIMSLSARSWQGSLWDSSRRVEMFGHLDFTEDGGVTYQVFDMYDSTPLAGYSGDYRVVVWEGERQRPGTLELDMTLDYSNHRDFAQKRLKGAFQCGLWVQDIGFSLTHLEGDGLLDSDDTTDFYENLTAKLPILGAWEARDVPTAEDYDLTLLLEFFPGNVMRYSYGLPNTEIFEAFTGNFVINNSFNHGDPIPESVTFFLTLTGGTALEDTEPYSISGTYTVWPGEGDTITVMYAEGDAIFYGMYEDEPITFERVYD